MAKKENKFVDTFTVLLAVLEEKTGYAEYKTEVIEGVDSPQRATQQAQKKNEKLLHKVDVITVFTGEPRIVNSWEIKKVPIEKQSAAFRDITADSFFISDDLTFLKETNFQGIVDLYAMFEDPCLTDALNEGTVTVAGIQAVIDFFGEDGATPGGIKVSFLEECLAKPNVEYSLLNDCPVFEDHIPA